VRLHLGVLNILKLQPVAMTEEEIIKIVLNEALYIHKNIGPGMLENVYKTCLVYRLKKRGLLLETERAVPVFFEEVKMDCGYRADIVVENRVVIEIKSIEGIGTLQVAQVLTYLRFLGLRYGLILNFNVPLFKNGIRRVLNGFGKSS
jgi:GxxExxY protein